MVGGLARRSSPQASSCVSGLVPFADLIPIARRQHACLGRDQVLGSISRRQLDVLLEQGRLERIHSGVYRVAGSTESWEQSAMAAVLAGGEDTVVSFRAAAYLWNLAGFWEAPGVEVTTPSRRRVSSPRRCCPRQRSVRRNPCRTTAIDTGYVRRTHPLRSHCCVLVERTRTGARRRTATQARHVAETQRCIRRPCDSRSPAKHAHA